MLAGFVVMVVVDLVRAREKIETYFSSGMPIFFLASQWVWFHELLFLVLPVGIGLLIYLHRIPRCRQVATCASGQWNA